MLLNTSSKPTNFGFPGTAGKYADVKWHFRKSFSINIKSYALLTEYNLNSNFKTQSITKHIHKIYPCSERNKLL